MDFDFVSGTTQVGTIAISFTAINASALVLSLLCVGIRRRTTACSNSADQRIEFSLPCSTSSFALFSCCFVQYGCVGRDASDNAVGDEKCTVDKCVVVAGEGR